MMENQLRRLVRSISVWRMISGLLLAPIPPAIVAMPLIGLPRGDFNNSDNWFLWTTTTVLALPWALLAGGFYLWRKRRDDGTIARYHCLGLGAALGFALPFLHLGLWLIHDGFAGRLTSFSAIVIIIAPLGGMLLIPFGLFGGWVFWRIAVRPAPLPGPAPAVFE